MFFCHRLCFVAAVWMVSSPFAFAQLVEIKKEEPAPKPIVKTKVEEKSSSLVVKMDAESLPLNARLRLGRMSGYRYAGNFSQAIMSPDGTRLAVAGMNQNSITILDLTTDKTSQQLPLGGFGGGITNMAFSPDGKSLAVGSFQQDLRVWELGANKQPKQFPHRDNGGNRQHGPSFSGDGKIVAVGAEAFGPNGTQAQIKAWEVASGKLLGPFETLHNYNIRVAVAPDGKTMISWGQYLNRNGGMNNNPDAPKTLQVWNLATGKELRQIKLDFGPQGQAQVQNLVFTPDGKTLVVSSGTSTFHLIDFETGKETRRFAGHRNRGVGMMRISPDGQLLAAYDTGGGLQAWELKSGKRLELLDGPKTNLLSVGFPDNRRILALGSQAQSLHWWDATAKEKTSPFQGHLTTIAALAFTPDGKTVISAGQDQRLFWWNAQTGAEERVLRLIDDDVNYGYGGVSPSFALAPDGRYAATLGNNGSGGIRLWNLKTARVICDYEGPRAYNQIGIAFSPDSTKLAATGSQTPLHVWDINTGQELPKFGGVKQANVNNNFGNSRVAFSPDGKILAVHSNQYDRFTGQPVSDLVLWDVPQSREMHRLKIPLANNANASGGMAFSTDGKLLALCEGAGSILLLNPTSGKELRRFHSSRRNSTFHLAFSADQRFLAVGSAPSASNQFNINGQLNLPDSPSVEIWELASGQLRETFQGHTGAIVCMAFAPDGATLATGSVDGTAILWDFTGKSGAKLPPLSADELPKAWKSLASSDAQTADTIHRMIASPAPTLAFLKKSFLPAHDAEISTKTLEKLVANLDSRNYETRTKAMLELQALGERTAPYLRKSLSATSSLEVRRRLTELLAKMERSTFTPEELQALHGIEVLERIADDEACAWLKALSAGTSTNRATQEAQAALKRLNRG